MPCNICGLIVLEKCDISFIFINKLIKPQPRCLGLAGIYFVCEVSEQVN